MNKNSAKKFSKLLISASLRGLAVFLVFGAAIYAYAAVTYPANQPNPVSGVVGLYVGKTPATYNGGAVGNYAGANSACTNTYPGTHVCTPMEMINTYNHNPTAISTELEPLWLNSGAPSFYSAVTNDCLGWTTSTSLYGQPVYGSVWYSEQKYGMMTFCTQSLRYACCK